MSKSSDNRNIRVLQFLDAYEKQECLWNPALESYKNKAAREEAYMNIIKELNVSSLTIHDVKLKVKSIRTTYTKELRLLTKHKAQGKPYNPKLFWFQRANMFLRNVSLSRDKRQSAVSQSLNDKLTLSCVLDYITDKSTRQSPDVALESADNISNAEDDAGNTSSSTYEYKTLEPHMAEDIAITTTNVEDSSVMKQPQQLPEEYQPQVLHSQNVGNKNSMHVDTPTVVSMTCSSTNKSGDDDYDLFCRSVAAQLRSITDTYSRSVAKLKIQQILFEAETGHYRNSPCITIPVSQHINSV